MVKLGAPPSIKTTSEKIGIGFGGGRRESLERDDGQGINYYIIIKVTILYKTCDQKNKKLDANFV